MDKELTPEEQQLIEIVRSISIKFGRVPLVLYIQHGKLVRVEIEKVVESRTIKTERR